MIINYSPDYTTDSHSYLLAKEHVIDTGSVTFLKHEEKKILIEHDGCSPINNQTKMPFYIKASSFINNTASVSCVAMTTANGIVCFLPA